MRNLSIRFRILSGLVIVNLLGAIIVVVYLHQSVSGSLDVWAQKSVLLGQGAWQQTNKLGGAQLGNFTDPQAAAKYVASLKAITGSDYTLLIDKSSLNADTYKKQRAAANLPNNWNERQNYVVVAATDPALADKAQFNTPPANVPDIGKVVGVENGACTAICHRRFKQSGDYWVVSWSTNGNSSAHSVFPVKDASGKSVGTVYAIENITQQADAARNSVYQTMIVIILTLIVATIIIGGMLDVLIFRRMNAMITTMEDISVRVAGGDFDAHFTPDGTNDEIGQFESFFARFLDLVTMTLKSLIK